MADGSKLNELLSHRPLGRRLSIGDIEAEFALIRKAFEDAGRPVPGASDFARVGRGSGTHLLKLVSSRAPSGQVVLRIVDEGANRHPPTTPSIDAKKAPHAKLVHRPLEIEDRPARSLADHILNPDEMSDAVTRGFAAVFGQDALSALRAALTDPLPVVTTLPAAEFPIVFVPRPGGGDLQITPLAPAEASVRFGEVTEPYFRKMEEGQPRTPRGRWHHQQVTEHPKNISSAIGKRRTRFLAEMPRVLERLPAELLRYAKGGGFPGWRDDGVVDAVTGYADLLDRGRTHSDRNIRSGLDRRADALVRGARAFIDETVAEARAAHPDAALPAPPPVVDVILARAWPRDGRDRARRVLTGDHFRARLRAAREV